ncbi:MAG: hypothetical protein ACT4O0_09860 [Pseudonocardia sp.]
MATTSPAPTSGPGRPAGRPGPPPGYGAPRPADRPLTRAQRSRVVATFLVLVVVGAALGLLVASVLPKEYAAQSSIRYTIGRGSSGDADRVLATQTVLITGREVLQGAATATGVPVDYLSANTTAAVVPNSEIIDIQVRHSNRASGVQLADAVAKRYLEVAEASSPRAAVQKQLADLQQQLASATTAAQLTELRLRVAAVQSQLDALATTENLASLAAPAYSVPDPVFPNTLATVGGGALLGLIVAGLVVNGQVRRFQE